MCACFRLSRASYPAAPGGGSTKRRRLIPGAGRGAGPEAVVPEPGGRGVTGGGVGSGGGPGAANFGRGRVGLAEQSVRRPVTPLLRAAAAMSSVSPIQIPRRLPLLLTHEGVLLPGSTMRTSVDSARNLQLVRSRLLKGTSLQSTILGVIPNTPDPASDAQDLPPLHR